MDKLLSWLPKPLRAPAAVLALGALIVTSLWAFEGHYSALAADVAKTTTEAVVNKAVIDSVRSAARDAVNDAVKDKLDDVAQRAAEAAVQKYAEKQAKDKKKTPR